MPDLNYSILVHRKNLRTIWRSSMWAEARTKFLDAHTDMKCERCGRIGAIVPGHKSEDYLDMATYVLKVAQNRVQALCPECNRNEAKGRKPCPVCVALKKIDMWYIPQHLEYCPNCRSEEEKRVSEQNQQQFKVFMRKVQDEQNAKKRKFYRMVKQRQSKS